MLLYHGSPNKYDTLIPHQAYDTGFAEGCQNAVYATTSKAMAICFALGAVPDSEKFVHALGTQYVCFSEVVPREVIEINVDEYLDYCIEGGSLQ